MRIGIAGIGRMGSAIAERLMDAGHEVVVWNRSAEKLAPLVAKGATAAPSPKALADGVETIITILTNAEAQSSVYDGAAGVLAGSVAGKLVIDMSTVRPEAAIALGERVTATGAAFVECPVGGSVGPARNGQLIGIAGASEADFARAKPLLDQMCRRAGRVGPVGAGSSVKLCLNLPLLVYYQALSEAYLMCRHLGLDQKWLMELLAETSGGPNMLKTRGPAIADALAGRTVAGPITFDVDSIRKDLQTMLAEGRGRGAAVMPVTEAALGVYDAAAAEGWGGKDGATIPSYWVGKQRA